MSKVMSYDMKGLEEALGVKNIRRAVVTVDIREPVVAQVEYYLTKEQADKFVDSLKDAKKPKGETQL